MLPSDRQEIAELLARWAYAFDEKRIDMLEDCFIANATFEMRWPDHRVETHNGRPAILENFRKAFAERQGGRRHVTANTWLESESATAATAVSFLVVVRIADRAPAVHLTGVYRDEVVKEDRWRIKHRLLTFDT
jgi:3-phenylpropionate/cinnamic acid dioxygenase small subunit